MARFRNKAKATQPIKSRATDLSGRDLGVHISFHTDDTDVTGTLAKVEHQLHHRGGVARVFMIVKDEKGHPWMGGVEPGTRVRVAAR